QRLSDLLEAGPKSRQRIVSISLLPACRPYGIAVPCSAAAVIGEARDHEHRRHGARPCEQAAGAGASQSSRPHVADVAARRAGAEAGVIEDPDQARPAPAVKTRREPTSVTRCALLGRIVLSRLARAANAARWSRTTPEERAAVVANLNAARGRIK